MASMRGTNSNASMKTILSLSGNQSRMIIIIRHSVNCNAYALGPTNRLCTRAASVSMANSCTEHSTLRPGASNGERLPEAHYQGHH